MASDLRPSTCWLVLEVQLLSIKMPEKAEMRFVMFTFTEKKKRPEFGHGLGFRAVDLCGDQ